MHLIVKIVMSYLVGTEVKFDSNFEFDVNGVHKIGGESTNINKVELSGNLIW